MKYLIVLLLGCFQVHARPQATGPFCWVRCVYQLPYGSQWAERQITMRGDSDTKTIERMAQSCRGNNSDSYITTVEDKSSIASAETSCGYTELKLKCDRAINPN